MKTQLDEQAGEIATSLYLQVLRTHHLEITRLELTEDLMVLNANAGEKPPKSWQNAHHEYVRMPCA